MYGIIFVISIGFWFLNGRPLSVWVLIATAIGIANGVGLYIRWKALNISLSGTSVLSFPDDLIAMGLSFFFLKEWILLNLPLGIGIALASSAAIALGLEKYKKKEPLLFFWYVGGYSVIWGLAYFLEKLFAITGLHPAEFMFGWYGGCFLSATALMLWHKEEAAYQNHTDGLKKKDFVFLSVLSLAIFTTMWAGLVVFRYTPQIAFQPILLVSEAIIPTAIGLWLFKERHQYSKREKVLLGIAILGVIFIALGLR